MNESIPQDDAQESRRQLHDLIDRNEIADLVSRLGIWLDDKRFDDGRSIFTEDATATTPGGSVQGVDLMAEQARRNHDVERTQHVITNVLIDLEGDRATVREALRILMDQGLIVRRAGLIAGKLAPSLVQCRIGPPIGWDVPALHAG